MRTRHTSLAASFAFGAAIALATPAFPQGTTSPQAQPSASQQMPMGPGMGSGRMGRGMGSGMMQGRGYGACRGGMGGMMGMGRGFSMMYHTEGSLAFLNAELKITDKQAGVWSKFATAMRASADSMRATMQAHMAAKPPATFAERLDRHEDMMAARLESLRSTKAALLPLYNALDTSQKQKLDAMMMPCRGTDLGGRMDSEEDDAD